ncbi:hypothetical protein [Terricaulis silvestris]|uniref:Uncharacterized protein n=1 Tax=Terricaulis silvestris TaxID=2686094 RepID=A0A6I6MJI7_9CAUL|nr:hypothetical protein [Terricaulis silvestris]QGZ93206.1 hypothetical protein DSM104635_00012 [Terricaulis silvestris]
MALIVVRDVKADRERIINTDYIFHCYEEEGGVRINYSQGVSGRDSVTIAGGLDSFAKTVGALKVG